MPTLVEIWNNILLAFPDVGAGTNYGFVLMIDEIKLEERL
jgi:hypothetical protein